MPAIFVRSGRSEDVAAIMAVIGDARAFLHGQHIDQWQGAYPDQAAVEADIAAGYSRVLVVNGQAVGIAALVPGPDPYYQFLEGHWTNGRNAPYVAIHRFAIGDRGRGLHLARPFLAELFSELYRDGVRDVRIDTQDRKSTRLNSSH